MRFPRFYIYKCVVDDGGAPCIYRGRYTLSICKPAIRRTADVGDIIFAFGSNNGEHPPNRLVYIAVVSQVVRGAEYYQAAQYAARPGGEKGIREATRGRRQGDKSTFR
jgi:hypothetical protein